ncbi:MAG TPA: 3-dehydroquinate synthase [Tepidisphaeraceae bacterium]
MHTVNVSLSGSAYAIQVAGGLLGRVGEEVRKVSTSKKAFVVTDSNVGPRFLATVAEGLNRAEFQTIAHTVPAGENHKTLEQIGRIYDTLIGGKIDRQSIVIALGGGVIGDMAGFAAATVLRGVPFVQVPTTLLSMVDASVGGKTGIDHPLGKNLIGAFHQPVAVLIDPETLKTLPERELRSGLAECIKHDIIRDGDHFARLESTIDRALKLDIESLAELIRHNVAIKARVVEADPFEKGERAHLNFGHTFGHAIETISNYSLAHGECVAMGMVAASRLAQSLKIINQSTVEAIARTIARAGLPTGNLSLDPQAVFDAMYFDKKVQAGKLRLVLPDRIGHVVIRDDVPAELVRAAVESLRS